MGIGQMKNGISTWVAAVMLSISASPVWAASLQVAPISLQFSTTENAKELWLTNTSDQPIRAQTRVQEWSQQDNKDIQSATKNVVVSPMVTEIAAGEKQLIRVIKVAQLPQSQEQTYRLIIDELPSSNSQAEHSGLQLLLQYSVPVFFQPTQSISSRNGVTSLEQVEFSFQKNMFSAHNRANSHIRISQLSYINPNGEKIPLVKGLLGYALANQTMSWEIPKSAQMLPNGKFEAKINMDGQVQILNLK